MKTLRVSPPHPPLHLSIAQLLHVLVCSLYSAALQSFSSANYDRRTGGGGWEWGGDEAIFSNANAITQIQTWYRQTRVCLSKEQRTPGRAKGFDVGEDGGGGGGEQIRKTGRRLFNMMMMKMLFCFVSRAGQIISPEVHTADAAEADDPEQTQHAPILTSAPPFIRHYGN